MQTTTQIKGLIRFSYPAQAGFELNKQADKDVAQVLFDPARLQRRLELFRRFTLPSLVAQTDQNFTTAVLIGDQLPVEFRNQLEHLLAPYPFAEIVALPTMPHYEATQQAFAAIPTAQEASHVATFRLDDDDAIHIQMIERIRKLAQGLLPMRDDDRPFAIGFMRGYFMSVDEDLAILSQVSEKTPLGIGLTLVAPVASDENVFIRNNHRSIAAHFDTYTEARGPMFIRTVHDLNDSGAVNSGKMWSMRTEHDWRTFHDGFSIDLEGLELHTLYGRSG